MNITPVFLFVGQTVLYVKRIQASYQRRVLYLLTLTNKRQNIKKMKDTLQESSTEKKKTNHHALIMPQEKWNLETTSFFLSFLPSHRNLLQTNPA